MANILDYLEWRGDLSFTGDGFNEVDNLILSNLSYLRLDGIVSHEADGRGMTLSQLADHLSISQVKPSEYVSYYYPERIAELLAKAAKTNRFQNIKLSGYVNQVDYEISKQFSAIVFSMEGNEHFIAFRGTDNTLAGWKENFHMSFMDEVLAQKQSISYVRNIASMYKGNFYLGGHSKGGNLAVYAAVRSNSEIRDRIINVYNNDGPGFQTSIIQSEEYLSMLNRIHTFIPKASVIGMLFEHGEEYKVVDSSGIGIIQHDAFLWQVKGSSFVYEKRLNKNSVNVDNTIRSWLNRISAKQREDFFDALFEIIHVTGVQTFSELSQEKLKAIDAMMNKYRSMDPETQLVLKDTLAILLDEGQKTLRKSVGQDINYELLKIKQRK